MAPPKLTYFSLKGLAEPIRFILSYAGEEFIDDRVDFKSWPSMKPNTPFGKLPVIEIDGKVIAQSFAICRYYARKAKIAGQDDFEAMLIDSTVDAINDLRLAVTSYYWDADEASKKKKYEPLIKETNPFFMERLEKQVKENQGYFVNGKLSWADLYFAAILGYMNDAVKINLIANYPHLKALNDKVLAIPAIKAWVAKRPVTEL